MHESTVQRVNLLNRAHQQSAVHQGIDFTRNSARFIENRIERVFGQLRAAVPACALQTVHDIGFNLVRIHGIQMMRGDNALAQLFQRRRRLHQIAKLWLAQQENLQQGRGTQLEIRQHAQFFQRIDRQILRLVHDQQAPPTSACLGMQKVLNGFQCGGFVEPACVDAIAFGGHLHHVVAIQMAGDDGRSGQARLVDSLHQMADQCRFACPHFASDDDKAFTLRQAITKV